MRLSFEKAKEWCGKRGVALADYEVDGKRYVRMSKGDEYFALEYSPEDKDGCERLFMAAKKKIKITRNFSGKPEAIWRLMAVQRKLVELGRDERKSDSTTGRPTVKTGRKGGKK